MRWARDNPGRGRAGAFWLLSPASVVSINEEFSSIKGRIMVNRDTFSIWDIKAIRVTEIKEGKYEISVSPYDFEEDGPYKLRLIPKTSYKIELLSKTDEVLCTYELGETPTFYYDPETKVPEPAEYCFQFEPSPGEGITRNIIARVRDRDLKMDKGLLQ
ncbi:MAG: hypothetical protein JSU81_11160 [Candidatus Coatesbacteria bacterium]|nr:MAG: hypothetical protein JSU81_11160 [Candidatus Coatesbacteria bacterium]